MPFYKLVTDCREFVKITQKLPQRTWEDISVWPSTCVHFPYYCLMCTSQGATTMDVDDEEDLVPEITKAHFEEAMKFARRSVIYSFSTCSKSLPTTQRLCQPQRYLYCCAVIDTCHLAGLCPTTTSRSTRCSRRPFSRAVASATTSGDFYQIVCVLEETLIGSFKQFIYDRNPYDGA